jgi:hypothetical protein
MRYCAGGLASGPAALGQEELAKRFTQPRTPTMDYSEGEDDTTMSPAATTPAADEGSASSGSSDAEGSDSAGVWLGKALCKLAALHVISQVSTLSELLTCRRSFYCSVYVLCRQCTTRECQEAPYRR